MALSLLHSNGGATTAAATTAAAAAAAGPCGYSESESESSPGPPSVGPKRPRPGEMSTVIAVAAARRRGPQLLCLLATGNRHGCVDAAKEERKAGCRLFGIVCVGDGDGAGAHSCAKVSTIPLEAGTETEGRAQPAPGLSETQRCQMFSDLPLLVLLDLSVPKMCRACVVLAKAQLCVSASEDLWQLVHRSRSREVIYSLIAAGLCQDTSHFFRSHLAARHLRGKYCLCMVCVDRFAAELALALSAACFAFAPPFFSPCK